MTDIVTIIEIKYGGTVDYGRMDLPKMKMYVKSLGYDCQYYLVFIDERMEYLSLPLLDCRSRRHWAKGCFTELNAGYLDGAMWFEVNSYNGLNRQVLPQELNICMSNKIVGESPEMLFSGIFVKLFI